MKFVMSRYLFHANQVMTVAKREGAVERAGGNVICQKCGLEYYNHPKIHGAKYEGLVVTCDWRVFKI